MRKIVSLLLALAVCFSLALPAIPSARAATGDEIRAAKKIISVVYDDSGSMYGDRWVYANYAMQALTAQLNARDELYITYMSNPYSATKVNLSDINAAVTGVRNWSQSAGTPGESLNTAKAQLDSISEKDSSTQFWLVILTDGVIEMSGTIQSKLNSFKGSRMSNGSTLNIVYLAMGPGATSANSDAKDGLYAFDAANLGDITDAMAEIANLVSSRIPADRLKQVDDTTISFSSDLPLYSISVLAQQSTASVVGADSAEGPLNINRNIPLDASDPFFGTTTTLYGNAAVLNLIDSSGTGSVIQSGTYTIKFSEPVDISDLVVQYEPAIGMKLKVTRGGVEVQDTGVLASGEKVNIELIPVIPGTDQEIKDSSLPKGIIWSIEYVVDGNAEKTEPGNKLTGVILKSGDNMIRGTMQIPGFAPSVYEIYFDIEEIVYNFGIKVDQPDPLAYYRSNGETTSEHGSLTFWITNDGVPLTKEELKALDLKLKVDSLTCDDSGVEGFLNRFGKVPADCSLKLNDDGSFTMTPNPIVPFTSFLTKAGDYTLTVTVNRDSTVTATGRFTLLPRAEDWIELIKLVVSIIVLWHLIYTLFIKYKFHGQEVRFRRYQLRDDNGGGIPLSGPSNNDSCTLSFMRLFTPYNFLAFWERGCIYKYRDLTLVAGPGGTVSVSGKSIAKTVSHYGLSSEDPETRLKRINKSLDATEMVIDEEKGKTVRTAMDTPLSAETPVYFRTRPDDDRIWSLYFGE